MRHNELLNAIQNLTNEKPKQRELAEALSVDISVIGKRASRNSEYTYEELKKINYWYGMKYFNFNLFSESPNTNSVKKILSNCSDEFQADLYPDVFGSCGSGTFVLSETKEKINISKTLVKNYSQTKKYSVINARGDSMIPSICDKDLLIVEHCENNQIIDNKIYVFCYDNCIFVKRLVRNIDEIIVKSDNPDPIYSPRHIYKEDINNVFIIGRIVGLMRGLN